MLEGSRCSCLGSMGKGDINPGFTFFAEERAGAASPWEVANALKDARSDGVVGTSIDEKIRRRLADKNINRDVRKGSSIAAANGKRGKPEHAVNGKRAKDRAGSSDDEGLEGVSDDDGSSDESDAPLPGEEDDSDNSEVLIESDDGESDEEVEDESGSEEDGPAGGSEAESDSEEEESGSEDGDSEPGTSRRTANGRPATANGHAAGSPAGREAGSASSDEDDSGSDVESEEAGTSGAGSGSDSEGSSDSGGSLGGRKRKRPPVPAAGSAAAAAAAGAGPAKKKGKRQKEGKGGFFAETPEGTQFVAGSFADLHLSRPLLKAVADLAYAHPTPIQAACIPLAMTGRDICGSAMTGSGKTAAFGLPCLERLLHRSRRVAATYVLVLTPTRELAVQIHSMMQKLGAYTDVRVALVVGGLSLQAQAVALRAQPEIVVATPGRLIDHVRNSASVGLEDLQILVLDEADRLLEMGFAEEIREIVRMAPTRRQTMLFSATMTEEVRRLAALSLRQPVRLAADPTAAAPEKLTQEIVRLKGAAAAHKEAVLLALASRSFTGGRTIVFFKTKQRAHRAKILFGLAGLPAAGELHGDMTQAARLESLDAFRKGDVAFLLCTDVAARGLDILGVDAVLNYDAPATLTSYLHRIGRTARAGERGLAVTIIEDGDRLLVKEVVKNTRVHLRNRLVPAPVVMQWQGRLERLAGDVERIKAEEGEEAALRKAELQAQKALNMVEHEAEIYARPARTWFQTPKQKRKAADRARPDGAGADALAGGDRDEGGDGDAKGGKGKKQEKEAERAKRKREAAAEKEREGDKRRRGDKLLEETKAASRNIRGAKAIEQQLKQQGMRPAMARKAAAAQVSTVKAKDKKKKKKPRLDPTGEGLFEGDGTGKPAGKTEKSTSRVYAGGAKSGKLALPKGGLSKTERARVKQGGKGKHMFKSKQRHKRR